MLKPGGQFFFIAFEKSCIDDAYEMLDRGKWIKYNNRKSISPFYSFENPLNEYETVIKSLGYVDCHLFLEYFKPRLSVKSLEGRYMSLLQYTVRAKLMETILES